MKTERFDAVGAYWDLIAKFAAFGQLGLRRDIRPRTYVRIVIRGCPEPTLQATESLESYGTSKNQLVVK